MTKTKTIQHEYGSETIEVAECSSCGQETKVQKMREYRIYDNECEDYVSGSICPSCRELEHPLEYPSLERTIEDKAHRLMGITFVVFFVLLTMFGSLLLLIKIIGAIGGVI
jgi:Zn ribbon nucleic-acid-binding protein